jgi:hypothetical protein
MNFIVISIYLGSKLSKKKKTYGFKKIQRPTQDVLMFFPFLIGSIFQAFSCLKIAKIT